MRLPAGLAAASAFVTAVSSGCAWLAAPRPIAAGDRDPRLSHAALVARAEAACTARTRALAALPRPRGKGQAPAFFARVAAIEQAEATALAGLLPPAADERDFERLLGASRDLAELARDFPAVVRAGNVRDRHRAVASADRASERYDRAAARLGLRCRQSA